MIKGEGRGAFQDSTSENRCMEDKNMDCSQSLKKFQNRGNMAGRTED